MWKNYAVLIGANEEYESSVYCHIKTLIKNQLLKVMTVVGNIDEKQRLAKH